jgi:hypothetical protein
MKTFTFSSLPALPRPALSQSCPSQHWRTETGKRSTGVGQYGRRRRTLRLTFNEDLEPTFSTMKVTDASGTAITKEKAKVDEPIRAS